MTGTASLAATLGAGYLLGWSVAWPPGPINAEIVRRGLARGFWSAWSIALGASAGDFLWAIFVSLGASALARRPGVRTALALLSLVLLVALAGHFLAGAARALRARRRGETPPVPAARFDSSRAGILLGLTLALSSPWNIAFWLAVVGQQAASGLDLARALLLAASVVAGALTWSALLAGALHYGARFATPAWDAVARLGTGLVLLYFAARLALTLAGGR